MFHDTQGQVINEILTTVVFMILIIMTYPHMKNYQMPLMNYMMTWPIIIQNIELKENSKFDNWG